MPWEKQFDSDEALEKAVAAFWSDGYQATSMQDLVNCMGINRGSLYATFGDKRQLFLQALKRYDADHRQAWTARLAAKTSGKAAILGAFQEVIAQVLDTGARDGCLLVNTALERPPHDPEVQKIVARSLTEMEAFFRAMIERAQAAGEVDLDRDAQDSARALLGLFIGLRVLSRSRPEPVLLRAIESQAAAVLG